MNYHEFLKTKIELAIESGFEIEPDKLNKALKPHQREAVAWALRGGRRALFESFGLGKTIQEIEFCHAVIEHEGTGKALIVLPLGVKQEFTRDAVNILGYSKPQYVRTMKEVEEATEDVLLTNYERVRDGDIDPTYFVATSLDEASVLRSFGSKTYQTFLDKFKNVKYKLVATATPSPNKYKELIHYAGYLEVMDTGQALTRFFQRDSTKANHLTLYPNMEDEFWLWVSSWALFCTKPSDLDESYSDDGYELPELIVNWHELPIEYGEAVDRDGQMSLFTSASAGLKEAAHIKRDSIDTRVAKMKEIVDSSPEDNFLLWHDLENERHAIKKALPGTVDIYGSMDYDLREQRVIDFSEGKTRLFATKKSLSGSGCNFQRYCHREIFLGIDYEFNDFIQAIHRCYRFLQTKPVVVDIIYMENEREIRKALEEKWKNHNHMVKRMIEIIKKYGLSAANMEKRLERKMGVKTVEVKGTRYRAIHGDCVEETAKMESNSIDLIHTSIPFGNHYEYANCYDEDTQILTKEGFKYFSQVDYEDFVATLNPDTHNFEWQRPTDIIWQKYKGDMYHFKGEGYDLNVTPNHNMYVSKRVGNVMYKENEEKFEFVKAEELYKTYKFRKWRMYVTSNGFKGEKPEYIYIPQIKQRILPSTVLIEKIKAEDFMELAGWYISEGCASTHKQRKGHIFISQTSYNEPYIVEIENLLDRIGIRYRKSEKGFSFTNISLCEYLVRNFGRGSYDVCISEYFKNMDTSLLKILRDTLMKGDGTKDGMCYTSYSSRLRDDFQEICAKTGWRTSNDSCNQVVRIGQTKPKPQIRSNAEINEYDGYIGCVTVPNHIVFVRRNGKVSVSGNSYNDFGHNQNTDRFFEQMDFLTPELLRVLKPGRVAAIHVKDRILFGNATGTGMPTVEPFHALCISHYMKHGFQYFGMITVVTDVVRENNQTYRLGWTEQCKDGSKMGVGCPEYILLFRKLPTDRSTAYADEPVTKTKDEYTRAQWQIDAHAYWRSSGDRLVSKKELEEVPVKTLQAVYRKYSRENVYNYEEHVELAKKLDENGKLPAIFMVVAPGSWNQLEVWDDIARMKTLNTSQSRRKLQLHVCPLPQDIVERIINRYSNPDDLVYDPFGGLMTVPMMAVKMGRRGLGCELNPDYFRDGVGYLQEAENEMASPTLFDFIKGEQDE